MELSDERGRMLEYYFSNLAFSLLPIMPTNGPGKRVVKPTATPDNSVTKSTRATDNLTLSYEY